MYLRILTDKNLVWVLLVAAPPIITRLLSFLRLSHAPKGSHCQEFGLSSSRCCVPHHHVPCCHCFGLLGKGTLLLRTACFGTPLFAACVGCHSGARVGDWSWLESKKLESTSQIEKELMNCPYRTGWQLAIDFGYNAAAQESHPLNVQALASRDAVIKCCERLHWYKVAVSSISQCLSLRWLHLISSCQSLIALSSINCLSSSRSEVLPERIVSIVLVHWGRSGVCSCSKPCGSIFSFMRCLWRRSGVCTCLPSHVCPSSRPCAVHWGRSGVWASSAVT